MPESISKVSNALDLAQKGLDLVDSAVPVLSRLVDLFARSDARKADALLRRAGRKRRRAAAIVAADAKRGHARLGRTGKARWRELLQEAAELEERAANLLKSGS